MIETEPLGLDGLCVVRPRRFEDARGYFEETFNAADFAAAIGFDGHFVQDNESLSKIPGTVRGLHYQVAPSAQAKLVRVLAGSLVDVVVDIRPDSETFLQHVMVELTADSSDQLWVPEGMAHGFCTTKPDTVIAYKVTAFYDPAADRCINWLDPQLGIDWPVGVDHVNISEKDAAAPLLSDVNQDEFHMFGPSISRSIS